MSKGSGILTLAAGLLLHGNIRILAATSLITGLYVSMFNTIAQPFVLSLGFGLPVLGALSALGNRPLGFASSLVQPFAGYFADLVGRKLLIVLGSVVAIFSMASFLAAAFTHALLPLALGYFLFGFSLMSSTATQAMIAESVAMDPSKLDIAFSVVFFFTQVPGAFASFAGGFLADSFGYYVIFGPAILLESANLVILVALLKETGRPRREREDVPYQPRFSFRQAVRLPSGFALLFTPFAMDAFFFGLAGSIIYGMWVKVYGFTSGDIGLVVGTLSISVVVTQYPAARFLRRVGPRKSLAFSEFLTVLVMIGWLVTNSLPVYILLSVVFGLSVATWVPALMSLLISSAPPEERGSVSGKLAAFRGFIAFPAPIIGGVLFNSFGYSLPVALGLIGEVFTTLAILKFLPQTGGRTPGISQAE